MDISLCSFFYYGVLLHDSCQSNKVQHLHEVVLFACPVGKWEITGLWVLHYFSVSYNPTLPFFFFLLLNKLPEGPFNSLPFLSPPEALHFKTPL